MCHFLSALVVRNGDVLTHPMLDSHSDLVTYYQIPDGARNNAIRHHVKVELMPEDWTDASTWTWRVDDKSPPAWWEEVAASAEATLRARAQRMVLRDVTRSLSVGGCWIVCGASVITDVRAGRLLRVQDTAQVIGVWGSLVLGVRDSAQVRDVWGSRVLGVWGSAQVRGVRGGSEVREVWGSAQVRDVESSVILDESARAHLVTP